jgi:hypothetical protein
MSHTVFSSEDSSRQGAHDSPRPEVHDTTNTDYNTQNMVAVVMFDAPHSSVEEQTDDDYDDDDYDYDDDGEDTMKFPTPDSKQNFPRSDDVNYDVYDDDLRSFVAENFPPPSIDYSQLTGSDFSTEDNTSNNGFATPPITE